jgi:serine phosphatase RsbU (regulator of sigma subunit)/Tfp pilus assembly protein PilF
LCLCCTLSAQKKETSYIDSLKSTLEKEQPDTTLAKTYNLLAEAYRYIDPDLNAQYARKAIKVSRPIGYLHGLQSGYNLLAQSYENQGLYADAIVYYDSSLAITKLQNSKREEARILLNVSNVYNKTADYSTAAEYVMNSLELQEELNDTFGIAVCRLTLGNIQYGQGDYKSSLRNYISAMELNKKSAQNKIFEASTLANIGAILDEQGKYDSALVFFRQALVDFKLLKADAKAASAYNNVGACLFHLGKFDSAQYYYHVARAMNEKLDHPEGLVSSLLGLGTIHDSLGHRDSAFVYYQAGLRLSMQHNLKEDLLKTYLNLAGEYEKTGQADSALRYLRLYIDLNELLHGEDELRKLEQEDQNYSIRKKQEEQKLLDAQAQIDKEAMSNKISLLAGGVAVLILLSLLLYSRFRSKQHIATVLGNKNKEITQQKDEITDSINYARRIQDSILAPMHAVKQVIPESFIFYLPKDVVSGDFYWVEEEGGQRIFASVDCTGHGVPGALMSVVGFNLLNRAVKEMHLTTPSEILRELDYGVNKLLRQSESENTVKDGMDISICSYHPETRMLQYAGAFNPLYIVRNGLLSQVKADKSPIGVNVDGVVDSYTNHEIQMLPGDMVYLFSDGYADQFGGPQGKKLKYNRLRELLVSVSEKPVAEQELILRTEFNNWRGRLEQVDDVLIMGMRIS